MPSLKDCSEDVKDSLVKVSEGGRTATFHNDRRELFKRIRIDSCLLQNKIAADYILTCSYGDLIIELKGRDVRHAIDQVIATFGYWKKQSEASQRIGALIVCQRLPRADTKVQRAKSDVARKCGIKLTISARNQVHSFTALL